MPELRFYRMTQDWVLRAPERAERPEDFIEKNLDRGELPVFKETCPFCPGREPLTPAESFRWGSNDSWLVVF
jgi:UDPglucose--hexose-1-phosphate uridylyltransferase